jgi:hypothetical protein
MSLKAFHLLFIAASVLLLFGFSAYENYRYLQLTQSGVDLWTGFASSLFGFLLLIYAWFFLRKTKDISLL